MAKNEDEIVIPRHLKTNGRIDIKVGDEITLDIGKRYDSNTEVSYRKTAHMSMMQRHLPIL